VGLNSRISKIFAIITFGFLIAIPAIAGEYHYGAALLCADCHTMHFSQSHNYDGTTPVSTTPQDNGNWLGTSGPNPYLLKLSENNLCLACHDGQSFAPDVLGANFNSYVRQAGALNRPGLNTPYEVWKGHTLDITARPPGGVSNITMNCGQCHEPHGSVSFRNLAGPSYGGPVVTYTKGESYGSRTKTVDVWLKQWVKGDLINNYSYDSVRFNERNPNNGMYADFCQGCHQRFHGTIGSSEIGGNLVTGGFLRHPSAEVNIGAMGGDHSSIAKYNSASNRVHVMSNATNDYLANPGSGTFTPGDGLTPSCFSCHKAHGNQNPFGLIFMGATGTVTEEGTTAGVTQGIRNLCGQCHVEVN
jgi:nitrate reductase cytochrome c-type subunit